ncbi:MAG: lipid-A-disaccharide synthase [Paludibacteraceae bacterium]|nr:lipid-A-disaccharide synthase [Paludibacteraceae bacterium]
MKYFIIAGEASGDLHASNLMKELKAKDPQADFCFLGGDLMAAQGGRQIKHYRDMAFMGIVNVAMNLRTVLRNIDDCKKALKEYAPDVLILIDYPSFNLRIAEFCKKEMPGTPVYYYISPKIWAWKEWRIKSIKKYIDKMYTILPFETEFYAKHDFKVDYVGNPCVDSVACRENQDETKEQFIQKNGLDERPIVALLAGSRMQEINGCLDKMIAVSDSFKDYQFVLAAAPSIDKSVYDRIINGRDVKVLFGQTYDLLQHSRAAIVNSGTATLETALLRVPEVVVYNVFGGRLANIAKKLVLKIKFVSLVNLIGGHEIVKELIAADFTKENVKNELAKILANTEERKTMLAEYDRIINLLGKPGVANKAAEHIIRDLKDSGK